GQFLPTTSGSPSLAGASVGRAPHGSPDNAGRRVAARSARQSCSIWPAASRRARPAGWSEPIAPGRYRCPTASRLGPRELRSANKEHEMAKSAGRNRAEGWLDKVAGRVLEAFSKLTG